MPLESEVPPRPKSRNDMDDMKRQRFGRGEGKAEGHRIQRVEDLNDELDFADWYESFEQELGDASNDEYRYGYHPEIKLQS